MPAIAKKIIQPNAKTNPGVVLSKSLLANIITGKQHGT